MRQFFLLLTFFLLFQIEVKAQQQWTLLSPDGKIKTTVSLATDGTPTYWVDVLDNGTFVNVIRASKLGLQRNDCDFRTGLTFVHYSTVAINEDYSMKTGKQLQINYQANELKLRFAKWGINFEIIFRNSDDGTAFRYGFPSNDTTPRTVLDETSTVKVHQNGKAWLQREELPWPVYEGRYQEMAIGTSTWVGNGWCLPALLRPNNNFWVFITEADANANFYAARLNGYAVDGEYSFQKPSAGDGIDLPIDPTFVTPMQTPWRVIGISKEIGNIVESTIVSDLSSPTQLVNQDWIETGMSTWSWWSGFPSATDYNRMVPFIDLASSLQYPYFLVDTPWSQMTNNTIPNLVNYAATKNVKLWLWYNSGGPLNAHTYAIEYAPRDLMHIRAVRRAEFQKIKDWGIVGIKVDFFMSDKQDMMKYYIDILKDAADYQLMVNFHGSTIPRGWQRTYPHLMTMEAVKGDESLLFDASYRDDSPTNNVNLAFTRNIVGSMDYTPGIISGAYYDVNFQHASTASHELALVSLYESGVVHLCDYYEKYNNLPLDVKNILKNMPTAWDETKFVEGVPNDYVVLARRKGYNWYISGINAKNTSKSITLNPAFVSAGKYDNMNFADGASQYTFQTATLPYQTGNNLSMTMAPYGGFTILLKMKCLNLEHIAETISTTKDVIALKITANNKLTNTAKVTYSANSSVELQPNFESAQGTVFKAEIVGCPQ